MDRRTDSNRHVSIGVKICHHGAIDGVTGSCHELQLPGERSLLIDCGLFQGDEAAGQGGNECDLEIEFPLDGVLGLVVTHVHIDHVGRIPYLLAAGFRGPIFCSEASALLLPLVLEDALKVGFTHNASLIDRFLDQVRSQVVPLSYKTWHRVASDVSIKLHPAGHIMGSAYVEVRMPGPSEEAVPRRDWRVVFSGDLGVPHTPLLPAPRPP